MGMVWVWYGSFGKYMTILVASLLSHRHSDVSKIRSKAEDACRPMHCCLLHHAGPNGLGTKQKQFVTSAKPENVTDRQEHQ